MRIPIHCPLKISHLKPVPTIRKKWLYLLPAKSLPSIFAFTKESNLPLHDGDVNGRFGPVAWHPGGEQWPVPSRFPIQNGPNFVKSGSIHICLSQTRIYGIFRNLGLSNHSDTIDSHSNSPVTMDLRIYNRYFSVGGYLQRARDMFAHQNRHSPHLHF